MGTAPSTASTGKEDDQTVVSVGPYICTSTPGCAAAMRAASSTGIPSPPSSRRSRPASASVPSSASITAASEGVHWKWVTEWRRMRAAGRSSRTARSAWGRITTRKPRASVQSSSTTCMSKPMLAWASHVPGTRPPTHASIPANRLAALACVTCTALGRPVDPEV